MQTANGAPAGADEAITALARDQFAPNLIEPVSIFYGDFTGDGASDALAWADIDTSGRGGNDIVALSRSERTHDILAQ